MEFFETAQGNWVFYSKSKADHLQHVRGSFEVRYGTIKKLFEHFLSAYHFYYLLEEYASLWDVTIDPVLIETKVVLPKSLFAGLS